MPYVLVILFDDFRVVCHEGFDCTLSSELYHGARSGSYQQWQKLDVSGHGHIAEVTARSARMPGYIAFSVYCLSLTILINKKLPYVQNCSDRWTKLILLHAKQHHLSL